MTIVNMFIFLNHQIFETLIMNYLCAVSGIPKIVFNFAQNN